MGIYQFPAATVASLQSGTVPTGGIVVSDGLLQTSELDVILGAPDRETLIINPKVGQTIDLMKPSDDFNLYLDIDDFIDANDNFMEITIDQQNDFEMMSVQVKNQLKKDLGNPDRVKLFRKMNNILMKPV